MSVASDSILNQLEFLQRDDTIWVQRSPKVRREACMIARVCDDGVARLIFDTGFLKPYIPSLYVCAADYNDFNPDITKEDVILILKRAYVDACEAGDSLENEQADL